MHFSCLLKLPNPQEESSSWTLQSTGTVGIHDEANVFVKIIPRYATRIGVLSRRAREKFRARTRRRALKGAACALYAPMVRAGCGVPPNRCALRCGVLSRATHTGIGSCECPYGDHPSAEVRKPTRREAERAPAEPDRLMISGRGIAPARVPLRRGPKTGARG